MVVAGIFIRDGRVLLCRRRADLDWYPGAWDLVGGHVEAGESPEGALRREAREELAVEVTTLERLAPVVDEPGLSMTVFVVRDWLGEPSNAAPEEHEMICWFDADELIGLDERDFADPRLARWLLVEMIEEYARHTGHAGLAQEPVDGQLGDDPPGTPYPHQAP